MPVLFAGCLAVLMFALAWAWAVSERAEKRFGWGVALSLLGLAAYAAPVHAWMEILKASGKADWFLCGIFSATIPALIVIAVFVFGLVCLVVNIRGLVRHSRAKKKAGS